MRRRGILDIKPGGGGGGAGAHIDPSGARLPDLPQPKAPEDWERRWLGDKWSLRGQMFKFFMWSWEKGVTPAAVIRGLGPWGQNIVYKYVTNRFSHHGEP
jgi:hypothetical protein